MKELALIPLLFVVTGFPHAQMLLAVLQIPWVRELTVSSVAAVRVVCAGLLGQRQWSQSLSPSE